MSGTCAPTHALLSGLVHRVRTEGYEVTEGDVEALVGLGIPREEIISALAAARSSVPVPVPVPVPDR